MNGRHVARRVAHTLLGMAWGLMPKPPKVVHVSGLRRSGNHACINWLANAVYGEKVHHRPLGHYLFRSFPDGRVLFINSYGQERAFTLLRNLWKHRQAIRRCAYLILSLEDAPPSWPHFLRPGKTGNAIRIHVDRSIFNVLASRARKMDSEAGANRGTTAVDFRINAPLLESAFADRRSDMLQWDFDRWLQDPAWRKGFLAQLGLQHDILPDMSVEGGGSSFRHAGLGTARYKEHPIPEAWLQLIEARFVDQLSEREKLQLKEIRTTRPGPSATG